jgi:hypothetical protein
MWDDCVCKCMGSVQPWQSTDCRQDDLQLFGCPVKIRPTNFAVWVIYRILSGQGIYV